MTSPTGITVGQHCFTDLTYADDAALLLPHSGNVTELLSDFSWDAGPHGLKASWTKTAQSQHQLLAIAY